MVLAVILHLILKGSGALRLDVSNDDNASLRVVPEFDWEARNCFWRLWDASLAVNVRIGQESNNTRRVGTREVESSRALLLTPIRAENCSTTFATEIAHVVLKFIVGEEEII